MTWLYDGSNLYFSTANSLSGNYSVRVYKTGGGGSASCAAVPNCSHCVANSPGQCTQCSSPVRASRQYTKPEKSAANRRPS